MNLQKIEVEDRAWMEACREPGRHPFSALSFPTLYCWQEAYGFRFAGGGDWFAVHSEHDGAWYYPCGEKRQCEAFLKEVCESEEHPRFLYLTQQQAEGLVKAGLRYLLRDDLSEYICSCPAMALESGYHASRSFRNKIRKFQGQQPYRVRQMSEEDIPRLREAARRFSEGRPDDLALERELNAFTALGLRGLLLETEDGRLAFVLGYRNTESEFVMSIVRHEEGAPREITAVLLHEMARMLLGKVPLVNLEDDCGLPGLRQAKMLYSPVDRLNVYEAYK